MVYLNTVRYFILLGVALLPSIGLAESQSALSMTAPDLSMGASGSFSTSHITGAAASNSGSILHSYAGITKFIQTSGTGKFSALNGVTRYGVQFDTFQIFQSFLTSNFFTLANSGSSCPSASDYNYMLVRFRSSDVPRNPQTANSVNTFVGGSLHYDPVANPIFSGGDYFNLAGPTLTSSPSHSLTGYSGASCASGKIRLDANGTTPFDPLATLYFGARTFALITSGGNPKLAIGVPQQTLSGASMTALSDYVFTGLYTEFSSKDTQVQKNVYLYPDSSGTTFTIRNADSLTDPTSYTNVGTLTCTSLNSPMTGFCNGTLTLDGVGGSGNAACLVSTDATENLLMCSALHPSNNAVAVSFITKTNKNSALQLAVPATAASVALANDSTTLTATLTNLSSRYIPTLGEPADPSLRLATPWTNASAYGGGNGTCGTSLKAYNSCTFTVTYNPSALGTHTRTFRSAYDNGTTTVNATTTLIGTAGLSSIAVTPSTSSYIVGATPQFTATATYSDASTQDVTSAVIWSSDTPSNTSITSAGLGTVAAAGAATISANLAAVSGSRAITGYSAPPDVGSLTATSNFSTVATLAWVSGGATTSVYTLSYQSGATAPASCSLGTTISSATIGSATSYDVIGLTGSTQYSFRVCAKDANGNAASGTTVSVTTPAYDHRIFVTSTTNSGNLGGLSGADTICQTRAVAGGFSGTWKAILSDTTFNASSRIVITGPVYNTNNTLVATGKTDFWDGALSVAVGYNEFGVAASANTWSGSTSSGAKDQPNSCSNWTSNSASNYAAYGQTGVATSNWIAAGSSALCSNNYRLYCINNQFNYSDIVSLTGYQGTNSGDVDVTIDFPADTTGYSSVAIRRLTSSVSAANGDCTAGTLTHTLTSFADTTVTDATGSASTYFSYLACVYNSASQLVSVKPLLSVKSKGTTPTNQIFVTSTTYPGNMGGLSGADAYCQSAADAGDLEGTWKALLSDSTHSGVQRLSILGAIYNLKGDVIATNKTDFWDGTVTAVNYNEFGIAVANSHVWTGSTSSGEKYLSNNCNDWGSSGSGVSGGFGASGATTTAFSWTTATCNNAKRIYCVSNQFTAQEVSGFSGVAGSSNGDIDLTIDFPADTSQYDSVVIRRLTSGSAAGNQDCTSGTAIHTYTSFADTTLTDSTGSASTYFSYLACVYNSSGQLLNSKAALAIKSMGTTPSSLIFVSSIFYTGNLGGISGADTICQDSATSAGLAGTWKAILSDSTTSAVVRNIFPGAVYNINGSLIANNRNDFWDGSFSNGVQYSENGIPVPTNSHVWTASTGMGVLEYSGSCSDWSSGGAGVSAVFGNSYSATTQAFNWQATPCNNYKRLLCIQSEFNYSAMTALTGVEGSSSGDIDLTIDFPVTTTGYDSVVIRRLTSGASTANLDCTSGTGIHTYTSFADTTLTDATGNADTHYSYLACVYNSSGQLLSAKPLHNIKTKGVTTTHRMFVSSAVSNGNLGGLVGADASCQAFASAAGHTGTWKALLSDSSTDAATRLTISGKIYNMNLGKVADNAADLWDASFDTAVAYTEHGLAPATIFPWTGSTSAGLKSASVCSDWASSSSAVSGTFGLGYTTNSGITQSTSTCDTTNRALYCISQ